MGSGRVVSPVDEGGLLVGWGVDGAVTWDPWSAGHALVVGPHGVAKSVVLGSLEGQARSHGWQVLAADGGSLRWSHPVAGHPSGLVEGSLPVGRELPATDLLLRVVVEEIERRERLVVSQWPRGGVVAGVSERRLLVVVDDVDAVLAPPLGPGRRAERDRALGWRVRESLDQVLVRGRGVGVHVLASASSTCSRVGRFAAAFDFKVVAGRVAQEELGAVFGADRARVPGGGEVLAACVQDGRCRKVREVVLTPQVAGSSRAA